MEAETSQPQDLVKIYSCLRGDHVIVTPLKELIEMEDGVPHMLLFCFLVL